MKMFLALILFCVFNIYSMQDSQIERYRTSLYGMAELINNSLPKGDGVHPLAAPFIEIADNMESSWNGIPLPARRLIVGSLALLSIQIKNKMMTQVEDPKRLEESIDPFIVTLQQIEDEIFKECNGL